MAYIKNEKIIHRIVGSFHFLVNPYLSYNADNENLFQTNEIGGCIWESIKTGDTLLSVVEKVLDCFNDEKKDEFIMEVTSDVDEFVSLLISEGFVAEESKNGF